MSVLGFIILLVTLLVIAGAQTCVALGAMYGMHRLIPEKLSETLYGQFDFGSYQKVQFQQMVAQLAVVFFVPTLFFHFFIYIFITKRFIVEHGGILYFLLFLFEIAAIAAGLFLVFRLDRLRLGVISGASALFYLIIVWYLAANHLLWG